MDHETLMRCYNTGCMKEFFLSQNKPDACEYHSGEPYFHDAYKEWTCCKYKSTDFTEFLNRKGCTKGAHNPTKPVAVEKIREEVVVVEHKPIPKSTDSKPRPSADAPLTDLPVTISASLQQLLDKRKEAKKVTEANIINKLAIGTACKNNACTKNYLGPDAHYDPCKYHNGAPVFHEGLKYWSCCQKKTTDFDVFLSQEGCQLGKHKWVKSSEEERITSQCRHDWFQTAKNIVLSIYAKAPDPEDSSIRANPVRLVADIVKQDRTRYKIDLDLTGVIDVKSSCVNMTGTKIEVKMLKAGPEGWKSLGTTRDAPVPAAPVQKQEQEVTPQMDYVDLSDLCL